MQIVIDIPEGLKNDFELEQWTALSCMEMKDALMRGRLLPKGHGDLIDAHELVKGRVSNDPIVILTNHAEIIIEADKAESEEANQAF